MVTYSESEDDPQRKLLIFKLGSQSLEKLSGQRFDVVFQATDGTNILQSECFTVMVIGSLQHVKYGFGGDMIPLDYDWTTSITALLVAATPSSTLRTGPPPVTISLRSLCS